MCIRDRYKCYQVSETIQIFKSLNYDSIKNENYINLEEFIHIKINDFLNDLKSSHGSFFARRKTTSGYMKTIEEFNNELLQGGFFANEKSSAELKNDLLKANDEFYRLNNYATNLENNGNIFYENEKSSLENGVILSLKNTNFVKWFFKNVTNPCHYYKTQKTKISGHLRNQVWRKYHGESETAICPISYCQTVMIKSAKGSMHIGHLISEKNGGKTNIDNLKPLCSKCNCEMGIVNWADFDSVSAVA